MADRLVPAMTRCHAISVTKAHALRPVSKAYTRSYRVGRDEHLQHPGFLLRRGQDRRRVTGSALRGRRCESFKFRHLFTRENTLPKGSEDDHERRAEVIRSR